MIVFGKGGVCIKEIGVWVWIELVLIIGKLVYLYFYVKVKFGWDEDCVVYCDIGFDWVE